MGQSAHGMKLRPPMDLLRDSGRAFAHFVTMNWFVSSLKGASAYGAELCLVGLASAHEVGLFGLARRIGTFLNLGIDPLVHTVTPEVYRLSAAGNRRTLWRFLASVTAYASLILAVLGSGIFIWRHELIELVGGDEFGAAAPTLVVILMALTVQFLFYWLHPLMLAFHRMKTMIAGQVGLALGLVAGGFFWIPSHGATGAAIALGVGYACQSMVFAAGAVGLNPPAGGAETAATEPREDSGE
jgi:O-antigen/teichoic acid export membrane protein